MHEHTVTRQSDGRTAIAVVCVHCRQPFHFQPVPTEGYNRWALQGEYIQKALPELTDGQREMLISGTCPVCWENLFGEDEEDDE